MKETFEILPNITEAGRIPHWPSRGVTQLASAAWAPIVASRVHSESKFWPWLMPSRHEWSSECLSFVSFARPINFWIQLAREMPPTKRHLARCSRNKTTTMIGRKNVIRRTAPSNPNRPTGSAFREMLNDRWFRLCCLLLSWSFQSVVFSILWCRSEHESLTLRLSFNPTAPKGGGGPKCCLWSIWSAVLGEKLYEAQLTF